MTRSSSSFAAAALLLVTRLTTVNADIYDENYWKYTGASTCYHTVDEPSSGLYYSSLATCCHTHYTTDDQYNTCIEEAGGTLVGSDKWYIDWSRTPDSCSKDCAEGSADGCGGYLSPHTTKTKYNSAADCCAAHFSSLNREYCAAISAGADYAGSDEYYLDSSEQLCVKDCESGTDCGGVLTQGSVELYATVELCCSGQLSSMDPDLCKSLSLEGLDGTNKWFKQNSICKKDCTGTGDECASAGRWPGTLYPTVDECCESLGWLDPDYCTSRSDPDNSLTTPTGYSDKWYVKWSSFACAKDCDSADVACEPLSANAVLHDTARECCEEHLGSVDLDTCDQASTEGVASGEAELTGTGKYYADYGSVQRCVTDCDSSSGTTCGGVAPRNAGVSLFDTVEECCSQKFGWYQEDLCQVLSASGGEGHTDLWYADQGKGVCYKDCDSSGGAGCNGSPSDFSQALYDDAEKCCKAKLGWINEDSCTSKSNGGPNAPATGTDKWFVNWTTKRCDKDCDSSAAECRGINEDSYLTMHDDVAKCCAAHFSYVNEHLCASISMESTTGSLKYYPDQGEGKCYQDCPSSTGDMCNGPPSDLAVDMYDTAEACCSGSIGWVDQATCAGASEADLATDEYWINWQVNKCVKNCPTSSGDGACGGIAKTWNPLYSSTSSCCSQPAFNNVDRDDCVQS